MDISSATSKIHDQITSLLDASIGGGESGADLLASATKPDHNISLDTKDTNSTQVNNNGAHPADQVFGKRANTVFEMV